MVAPVTGPVFAFPTEPFADSFTRGFRQKPPYDLALARRMYRYAGRRSVTSWLNAVYTYNAPVKDNAYSVSSDPSYARLRQAAFNASYSKLQAKISDSAGWAENIAQINKTRRSIIDRSVQLSTFVLALKRGQFARAARTLRTPIPSGVSNRKALAQNFLEWEYGIKPVISDLQSSMEVLLSDHGSRRLRGGSRERIDGTVTTLTQTSSFLSRTVLDTHCFIDVKVGGTVRVNNPNLYLANQLGVLDLALPWKLIPFSFVVDWFVNVEQVISSVTDWYGLELLNPYTTDFALGGRTYYEYVGNYYPNGNTEGHETKVQQESVEFERTVGISAPVLLVKPFRGFKLSRGLQAMALVVSVFGR